MEEVLSTTQEAMIRFLISLPTPEQFTLSQEARYAILKDPEAVRSHHGDQDQEQAENRDGDNTIVNGQTNDDCQ